MPKHKTRKSAAKRFKVTSKGKLLHRSQLLRHLRSAKNKKRLRRLKTVNQVTGVAEKKLKKMLGIG